jgi:hypothetical protein
MLKSVVSGEVRPVFLGGSSLSRRAIRATITVMALVSCGRTQPPGGFKPIVDRESGVQGLQTAEVIVLAELDSIVSVGSSQHSPGLSSLIDHPRYTQSQIGLARLYRLRAIVESVIRGDIPLAPVDVFFYGIPQHGDTEKLLSGQIRRAILFVRRDQHLWRLARDFDWAFLPYYRRGKANPSLNRLSDGQRISEMLLTPGSMERADLLDLADSIRFHAAEARIASGFGFPRRKLDELSRNPSLPAELRTEACLALAEFFLHDLSCLEGTQSTARIQMIRSQINGIQEKLDILNSHDLFDPYFIDAYLGDCLEREATPVILTHLANSKWPAMARYARRELNRIGRLGPPPG